MTVTQFVVEDGRRRGLAGILTPAYHYAARTWAAGENLAAGASYLEAKVC